MRKRVKEYVVYSLEAAERSDKIRNKKYLLALETSSHW